jgi:hypothetical protein
MDRLGCAHELYNLGKKSVYCTAKHTDIPINNIKNTIK